MAAYTAHDTSFFSRRVIVFIVACSVQVLGFLALALGFANKVLHLAPQPIQTSIVQQVQKKVAPPPPPPPKMSRPPVVVPPPAVSINVPVQTNSTAITDVTAKKKAPPPPPPPPPRVVYTRPQIAAGSPSTQDYYPPVSRRLDEQGTTIVEACPGPNGALTSAPKVVKSSGSSRLDQAALRWTRNAKFKPGTANGKPITRCFEFRVVFQLTGD